MKILIISKRSDSHAYAVLWGLQRLGLFPVIWFWEDFPCTDLGILRISQDCEQELSLRINGSQFDAPFDIIWKRRLGKPTPMDESHIDDLQIINNESLEYLENLLPFLAHEKTRWINEYTADQIADNKILQLVEAKKVGFLIPDTITGNNPEEIRTFFSKNNGNVIFKAFSPGSWKNEDGSSTALKTSAISEKHILDDYLLRSCPAIYQELIRKKHELRVTVMGDVVLAAAIYSQADGETLDWRYEGGRGFKNLKAIEISNQLASRCIALCRKLNLSFGCIDLIVKENDDIVFLEVNCAGQFLWKEDADPSIPMLNSFCKFLIGDAHEPSIINTEALFLKDYYASKTYLQFINSREKCD